MKEVILFGYRQRIDRRSDHLQAFQIFNSKQIHAFYLQWSSTHPNRVILLSNNCNLRKITVKLLYFTVKKQ